MPQLWVGLGNPGDAYQNTRHNAGFQCVDVITQKWGIHFQESPKFCGAWAKMGEGYFLKPSTFMNQSGKAVAALSRFYKIGPEDIFIFHDDLDLPPGQIRLKQGGGNGGHNGLKSVEECLGSNHFWRVRLGVGHPRSLNLKQSVVDFVLSPPLKEDEEKTHSAILRVAEDFALLQKKDFSAAQRAWHALK